MIESHSSSAGAAADLPVRLRHEARILAMQALCQFDVQGGAFEAQLDDFLSDAAQERAACDNPALLGDAIKRSALLARGTWHKRSDIARRISESSESWSLDRMALIDRNILRLGIYELLEQPDTPFKVVIDEALELAHQFCDADAPAFINGVLDAVRRKIHGESSAEGSSPSNETKS